MFCFLWVVFFLWMSLCCGRCAGRSVPSPPVWWWNSHILPDLITLLAWWADNLNDMPVLFFFCSFHYIAVTYHVIKIINYNVHTIFIHFMCSHYLNNLNVPQAVWIMFLYHLTTFDNIFLDVCWSMLYFLVHLKDGLEIGGLNNTHIRFIQWHRLVRPSIFIMCGPARVCLDCLTEKKMW